MLEGLQVPARVRQALDCLRLLPVPQEPCLLRTFSTAFVHPAVFAAAALSLRSICLLRSFSTAFPQVLGAATRSFQSLSIGVVVAGKRVIGIWVRLKTNRRAMCLQAEHM